jgi:RNA polymerase sigma-70 factor (ECF subfamily)
VRAWKKRRASGHERVVQAPDRVEALFRAHAADVLAYAMRRTDAASAEDAVAEVFATAWKRLDRIPHDEPVLWLYAVARRVLANQRRSLRRRLTLEKELRPLVDTFVAGPAESSLPAAVAALRRADREVLLLTAWEGLDADQIAAVLGCSRQAVYTRLHRARARLADVLQEADSPSIESDDEVRVP